MSTDLEPAAQEIHSTPVSFPATDGYTLSGVEYRPNTAAKANIIISSATGVPQQFYRRFAEYAAGLGYQVLTFDYRGIGRSAPPKLKGFKMSYLDWGRYDLSGAIAYMQQHGQETFLVGHSYGGQALGLTSNHDQIRAMYCFGTGAGWHGYMPFKEKMKVHVMWNIVFPPMVAIKGYLPWSKLNMGADLPVDVYKQWRRWCKNPTYFFADPELSELSQQYAAVQTPIYAVAALDDDWALPNSRHAFMQHYAQASMHYINIEAEDYGLKQIGHMGYFRKGAEPLWQEVIGRFDELLIA
ncbi:MULTISPECIES: alpha/beta fold hydrolase [unclassified Acinetobacter]|uniref:alpha/beta hydrolase family protein n=1 Tax=unclassified Acinetobacter TaxID=196816 RepID=UPI0015D21DE5|nr:MULTISPECIES: alpha/beta fold hydrolase [unclassified Acinetobacter]